MKLTRIVAAILYLPLWDPLLSKKQERVAMWLVAFGSLLFGVLVIYPWAGITKTNFDRIKEGMSRVEVEAILGRPTLKGTAGVVPGILVDGEDIMPVRLRAVEEWHRDDGSFAAITYENGRVRGTIWHGAEDSFFGMLRRLLHLPKA